MFSYHNPDDTEACPQPQSIVHKRQEKNLGSWSTYVEATYGKICITRSYLKRARKKNQNNFLQTKMQRHHSFCFSLSRRSKCLYMSSVRACRPLNLMRPRERIEKATDHAAETTRWHAVMKLCHLLTENKAVPFLCHPPRLSLLYPQCLCSL